MDIVILDTGCANLQSISIAIKKMGYSTTITSNISLVSSAKKIIIPGIGTASAVMKRLSKNKLENVIRNITQPILGICLGMQLLCSFSKEGSGINTLDILKNSFVQPLKSNHLPLPHMGWNKVIFNKKNILFKNIKIGSRFYFVHNYIVPINKYTLAYSNYGVFFSAAIQKNNFFGVQFHPEKSGSVGAQLLKNFIEI
ncbi:imidazole glycerol phosphate synthase subunit HisH [Buchnera aphidicola]|uniref:imidazole glycerol phosphate synthase subunit HisH n=1 Tax=Buchnera aphidicola TaxID=9 RepID=UPI003BEED5B2